MELAPIDRDVRGKEPGPSGTAHGTMNWSVVGAVFRPRSDVSMFTAASRSKDRSYKIKFLERLTVSGKFIQFIVKRLIPLPNPPICHRPPF